MINSFHMKNHLQKMGLTIFLFSTKVDSEKMGLHFGNVLLKMSIFYQHLSTKLSILSAFINIYQHLSTFINKNYQHYQHYQQIVAKNQSHFFYYQFFYLKNGFQSHVLRTVSNVKTVWLPKLGQLCNTWLIQIKGVQNHT